LLALGTTAQTSSLILETAVLIVAIAKKVLALR